MSMSYEVELKSEADRMEADESYDKQQIALGNGDHFVSAMAAVNELSKSMDMPTGRNYPAWNARKIEARRRMNSKPEPR